MPVPVSIFALDNGLVGVSAPYDEEFNRIVRTIPGRRWECEGRFWVIPATRLGSLRTAFAGWQVSDSAIPVAPPRNPPTEA
ncbi:MAG: hypothetical protein WCL50_03895, partial [Spirochaetota bacterium]